MWPFKSNLLSCTFLWYCLFWCKGWFKHTSLWVKYLKVTILKKQTNKSNKNKINKQKSRRVVSSCCTLSFHLPFFFQVKTIFYLVLLEGLRLIGSSEEKKCFFLSKTVTPWIFEKKSHSRFPNIWSLANLLLHVIPRVFVMTSGYLLSQECKKTDRN